MTYLLRRLPLSRLLLLCGLVVVIGISVTALAFALGTGPTPPPKPLADAIHDALAGADGEPIQGISANIQLTDHLLEGANLTSGGGEGSGGGELLSSPLVTGGSGRMWVAKDGRVRLELQSEKGDTQVLYDGHTVSIYDASSNTLYRYTIPPHEGGAGDSSGSESTDRRPRSSLRREDRRSDLAPGQHVNVSGATPTDIAGQAAYTVRVSPKETGSLIGGGELSWDAANGVPLRAAIYSSTSSSPAIELAATSISYGPVAASVFEFTPPANAKVEEIVLPTAGRLVRRFLDAQTAIIPMSRPRATASRRSPCSKARPRKARTPSSPRPRCRRPAEGQDQRHRSLRAAHRARHAAQLRALRRALLPRRRGQPAAVEAVAKGL